MVNLQAIVMDVIWLNIHLILAFFLATLGETVSPGPTLFLVIESKSGSGRRGALATVLGVTVANVIWVLVALVLLYVFGLKLEHKAPPTLIIYAGVLYLMYLASDRLLYAALQVISQQKNDSLRTSEGARNLFLSGLTAHAINPLTISYYFTTLGVAALQQGWQVVAAFCVIAIATDMLVYGAIAIVSVGSFDGKLQRPFVRLVAAILLFYFLAVASGKISESNLVHLEHAATTIVLLVGFLIAALLQASSNVRRRKGENNKLLWRVVKLWSVLFSILALTGGFYALVRGVKESAFHLSDAIEYRLRTCFVIAAVLAASLGFAQAFGEIQDELHKAVLPSATSENWGWRSSPWYSFLAIVAFLVLVFLMLIVTDFPPLPKKPP